MIEVKADGLEASFEALERDEDGVEALKAELALLKKRVDEGVIAAQRPALDGVKSAETASFVEQYLRKGVEAGLEQKAVGSSTDAIGGYAVPREIDEKIEKTLVAISPIRSIANVVKVGSAGYRKLITTGGTPSGWVAYEAARPMTNTPTFSEIVPAAGELYANPAASQQMLDDAMQRVDMLLCPVAEGAPQSAPPPSPALGSCYLVATGGSGAWAGQDGALACFTEAGWKLVAPIEGMRVLDRSTGQMMLRREGAWESGVVRAQQLRISGQVVVGPRQAAIPDPAGGSVVDAECRTALAAVLAALRAHGLIG